MTIKATEEQLQQLRQITKVRCMEVEQRRNRAQEQANRFLEDVKACDVELAEMRQLLKETEPEGGEASPTP